ncbi:Ycf66 family protein [Aerosakkonemataceae cyanobacterium BLCC-F154]|uniref:Ycf66 family protein n=1 Tax=Floridaenema fluviatile BLCC-F154 TaxID=3153640 RepID=A0ABV4Y5A2_9CYAN
MLNFGQSFATFLGIALALAGVGLYFLRSVRPELARDHDIFFAAISLVCGLILLFQGWRLDPILAFSQYLLAGSAVFFAVDNLRLRGVTTEQAKRNTPIVDEERPVSREYRVYQEAELDDLELEPDEELPVSRRIRGSRDSRSSRNGYYDEPRRRPSSRSSSLAERDRERLSSDVPTRKKRRPRPESRSVEPPVDDWGIIRDVEERPARSSSRRPPRDEFDNSETVPTRSRKRRPPEDISLRDDSENLPPKAPDDYVDYQPIDPKDDENNSGVY